jgi:hypothetical protein
MIGKNTGDGLVIQNIVPFSYFGYTIAFATEAGAWRS